MTSPSQFPIDLGAAAPVVITPDHVRIADAVEQLTLGHADGVLRLSVSVLGEPRIVRAIVVDLRVHEHGIEAELDHGETARFWFRHPGTVDAAALSRALQPTTEQGAAR